MFELAAMLCAYVSFCVLHAVSPHADRALAAIPRWLGRTGALLAWLFGVCLWSRAQYGPASWLAGIASIEVAATLVVLLAPVAPRVLWWLAAVALPAVLVLAAFGGEHG